MEYEFTVVGDMDLDHRIVISKSRYEPLQDAVETKPTAEFFQPFVDWLSEGESPRSKAAPQPQPSFSLDDLIAAFGEDEVKEANNGTMPESPEDIASVTKALMG